MTSHSRKSSATAATASTQLSDPLSTEELLAFDEWNIEAKTKSASSFPHRQYHGNTKHTKLQFPDDLASFYSIETEVDESRMDVDDAPLLSPASISAWALRHNSPSITNCCGAIPSTSRTSKTGSYSWRETVRLVKKSLRALRDLPLPSSETNYYGIHHPGIPESIYEILEKKTKCFETAEEEHRSSRKEARKPLEQPVALRDAFDSTLSSRDSSGNSSLTSFNEAYSSGLYGIPEQNVVDIRLLHEEEDASSTEESSADSEDSSSSGSCGSSSATSTSGDKNEEECDAVDESDSEEESESSDLSFGSQGLLERDIRQFRRVVSLLKRLQRRERSLSLSSSASTSSSIYRNSSPEIKAAVKQATVLVAASLQAASEERERSAFLELLAHLDHFLGSLKSLLFAANSAKFGEALSVAEQVVDNDDYNASDYTHGNRLLQKLLLEDLSEQIMMEELSSLNSSRQWRTDKYFTERTTPARTPSRRTLEQDLAALI